MLEAVGKDYIEPYFQMIDRVLNEEGVAVFQVITIPEARFESCKCKAGVVDEAGLTGLTPLFRYQTRRVLTSLGNGGKSAYCIQFCHNETDDFLVASALLRKQT